MYMYTLFDRSNHAVCWLHPAIGWLDKFSLNYLVDIAETTSPQRIGPRGNKLQRSRPVKLVVKPAATVPETRRLVAQSDP